MLAKSLFVSLALLGAASCANAQELVTNGGFESGDFTSWTQFGETTYNGVDSYLPHGGSYAAYFGPVTSGGIQQTITANVGDSVTVSFWYTTEFADQPNFIVCSLGSVQVCSLQNLTNTTYQQFSATVTVQDANPVLALSFSDPQDYIDFDDVSVLFVSGGGGPTCGSADFNCDGDTATDADIEAFFRCIAGDCPPAPCSPNGADFNGDGDSATDADIEAFFRVIAGGNC